jgi:thioredoxin reductase (NADPH)
MKTYDVIIIGAGPAGIGAATYTCRAKLKTLVLGDPKKGALYKAHRVGNVYPFHEDVTGQHITELSLKQAERFGAVMLNKEAVDLKKEVDGFIVVLDDFSEVKSRFVIICTGKPFNIAGIPNEKLFTGKGVHYCVVCDGFFYKEKKIAVVGHANNAAEETMQLLNYTKDIVIITNGKKKGMSHELEHAISESGIKVREEKISRFDGGKNMEKIFFPDGHSEDFDGCFIALGAASSFNFGLELGLEMEGNSIKIDRDGRTNVKGIFAAGDCTGGNAQVAKSIGEGCNAALAIAREISGRKTILDYD